MRAAAELICAIGAFFFDLADLKKANRETQEEGN